ncbi:MAG TPA: alpha/beta hydrolase, partial [Mesotoga sp.]|nr:alpha/beta hydrolase [Mesotoga sp.]
FSSSSRFEPSDLSHNKLAVQRYIDDPYVHDRVSPNLFLGMEESIEMVFSEVEKITIPIMIVIGSDDRVIDPSGAREFYEKLGSEKRFLEIAGGMHEMFADEERKGILFEGVVSFFSEFL